MLKAIVPVGIGASAAEALGRAAGGRSQRKRGTIIQAFIRRAHGEAEIRVANSVIGHIGSGCRGRAVDLRGCGLRVGKVQRHAGKDAKVPVEVVPGVGIELENLAVRIHGTLKLFIARKSFLRLWRGRVLAESRNGYEQGKQRKHLRKKTVHSGLLKSAAILARL